MTASAGEEPPYYHRRGRAAAREPFTGCEPFTD